MKTGLSAVIAGLLAFPVSTFACDGSVKCAMREAPRQVLNMLPGFMSTHIGLFAAMALGAVVIGISRRRESEFVDKD